MRPSHVAWKCQRFSVVRSDFGLALPFADEKVKAREHCGGIGIGTAEFVIQWVTCNRPRQTNIAEEIRTMVPRRWPREGVKDNRTAKLRWRSARLIGIEAALVNLQSADL
jgi:hypothetical protein